ncbi:MAG: HD domain-containing protein [Bacteroidales bacterium]
MNSKGTNKKKIINDPVHGFVSIPSAFIFDIIEHPYIQRLRRIKQLGLTHYVFPGATHSRFQHTIGAMHLMSLALESLKNKGIKIEPEEENGVLAAILLHDIGHGPFSHALEESLISGISHEMLSHILMNDLNKQCNGKLDLAIDIFNNKYSKKFLHQLVSSQLDMDRLDYIKRDSFFTGVIEGTIGTDRIIKMLNVSNDSLVVEKKGIYSVEKFLIARRLMYWQVYLHKTVMASEYLLVKMLQRAKYLANKGLNIFATPALSFFLYQGIDADNFKTKEKETISFFTSLDDSDILSSAKVWADDKDKVLSVLAQNLLTRKLPAVIISETKPDNRQVKQIRKNIIDTYKVSEEEADYLLVSDEISNSAFSGIGDMIQISINDKETKDLSEVSDILNVPYLQRSEKKYFICYPKNCGV